MNYGVMLTSVMLIGVYENTPIINKLASACIYYIGFCFLMVMEQKLNHYETDFKK